MALIILQQPLEVGATKYHQCPSTHYKNSFIHHRTSWDQFIKIT